ncbi:MAG: EthD domain-containing protein [Proteobacteria bacterium]|nr:EthD domain-containing protein [Pseudomonadota bacterium]
MLKFIIGFQRRSGMSLAECHSHLREVHGPLVASVPEFTRHVRGYVQNYAVAEAREFIRSDFVADGAAELWFDSAETFISAYSEPLYLERIRPDEANFTNPLRYVATFAREVTVWAVQPSAPYKLIRFLAPVEGRTDIESQGAWRAAHTAALTDSAELRSLAVRYVQNWSIPSSENPFPLAEPFAGVDEFWFDTLQHAAAFCDAEQALRSAPEGMHGRASVSLLVREGVMPGYDRRTG